MENVTKEIREIAGIKYEVVKYPCHCMCHIYPGIKHFMACCNDGWIEYFSELNIEDNDNNKKEDNSKKE